MPDEEEYKVTKRSGRGLAGAFVLILSLLPLPQLLAAAASQSPWFVRNDPSWVEQLSAPRYEIKLEYDVKIPMRDGVLLSADIWRPRAEGKFPVILMHMRVDQVQIRWPSGKQDVYRGLPVDSIVSIVEGIEPSFHALQR